MDKFGITQVLLKTWAKYFRPRVSLSKSLHSVW